MLGIYEAFYKCTELASKDTPSKDEIEIDDFYNSIQEF